MARGCIQGLTARTTGVQSRRQVWGQEPGVDAALPDAGLDLVHGPAAALIRAPGGVSDAGAVKAVQPPVRKGQDLGALVEGLLAACDLFRRELLSG